eukprot:TRINITY_DN15336_c1_g1_i4.p6 TRINITY_DN15336_c1_g1~~TRINITY_DN15336_c1_g1_i4.p6  ORF type:complete len:166 (-),score=1.56 TRINITY_DN15336_c1_g1_i4:97-594(-)
MRELFTATCLFFCPSFLGNKATCLILKMQMRKCSCVEGNANSKINLFSVFVPFSVNLKKQQKVSFREFIFSLFSQFKGKKILPLGNLDESLKQNNMSLKFYIVLLFSKEIFLCSFKFQMLTQKFIDLNKLFSSEQQKLFTCHFSNKIKQKKDVNLFNNFKNTFFE